MKVLGKQKQNKKVFFIILLNFQNFISSIFYFSFEKLLNVQYLFKWKMPTVTKVNKKTLY